jgi:hypothetical protein
MKTLFYDLRSYKNNAETEILGARSINNRFYNLRPLPDSSFLIFSPHCRFDCAPSSAAPFFFHAWESGLRVFHFVPSVAVFYRIIAALGMSVQIIKPKLYDGQEPVSKFCTSAKAM